MTACRDRKISLPHRVGLHSALLIVLLLPLSCPAAEEFKWSFGSDAEPGAAVQTNKQPAVAAEPVQPEPAKPAEEPPAAKAGTEEAQTGKAAAAVPEQKPDQPDSKLEVKPVPAEVAVPAKAADANKQDEPAAAAPEPGAGVPGKKIDDRKIGNLAYEEMLSENLELRKKISEASGEAAKTKKENERLALEVRDLEQRIGQFAARITDLKNEKGTAGEDPEKVKKLEQQVAAAEKDKAALADELSAARKRLEVVAATPPPVEVKPAETVLPGSDLFKEQEKENQLLKKKLAQIEAEKQHALEASLDMEKRQKAAEAEARLAAEKQKEMEARLKEAMDTDKARQKDVQKIVDQIPRLEKELSVLKTASESKEAEAAAKEKDLETLKAELKLREQRLIKAEKMARLMEKARVEVSQASDAEKRDMHYNMGVVYAKEGRYRDAETEYLSALSIDPTDSAAHYNLGVLYDDVLHDQKRAAMHYRRYIKLNPHGSDVDAVKNWLMRIEMKE